MKIESRRRTDIDWLRVLGVLLLVPFHAAQIFILLPGSVMYVKDTIHSPALTQIAGFIHMWHMPLLFILSGSATFLALGFRSQKQYLRERFQRLFIPLIFGILTYIPLTTYIQRSRTISLSEAYLGFFQIDLAQIDGMNGTFTPAHLWFILYLFAYSLVGLPIFQAIRSDGCKIVLERIGKRIPSTISLLLYGIPLALAAGLNILGDKNPIYYFLIFLSGFLIASEERLQRGLDKMVWGALVFGIFAWLIQIGLPGNYQDWTPAWILYGFIYEMGRWTLTLAALGLGQRFLNRTNRLLPYANQAAMPFYLLHMTFTVLAGFIVIQIDAPVSVKFSLIVIMAIASTAVAYELIRRWKVTRWLFGMKVSK